MNTNKSIKEYWSIFMSLRQQKTTIIVRNRTKTYGAEALAVTAASGVGGRLAETNKVSDRLADPDTQEN